MIDMIADIIQIRPYGFLIGKCLFLEIIFMIGGSVVIEKLFGWPGLGSLMINSITSRDYPVIMGISVIIAIVTLVTNLVVDILYAYLDPRITLS